MTPLLLWEALCDGLLSLLGENAKLVACMTCGGCAAASFITAVDVVPPLGWFGCVFVTCSVSSSRDVFINNADPVTHVAAANSAVIHMVDEDEEDDNGGRSLVLVLV